MASQRTFIGSLVRTLSSFYFSTLLSVFCLIVSPLTRSRRSKLASQVEDLTARLTADLDCIATRERVFLKDRNLTLHVVTAGDPSGKLVLLAHGFPENWHSWYLVIPALARQGYFVVAPDMRGYNLSDKPQGVDSYRIQEMSKDLVALIQHYKRDKAYAVVGHDWGGAIVFDFATRFPSFLERLVAVNGPHPAVIRHVLRTNWRQMLSSWYILFFQIPVLPKYLFTTFPLRAAAAIFTLSRAGMHKRDIEYNAAAMVVPGAMDAMLNYYKAMARGMINSMLSRSPNSAASSVDTRTVTVPTLIVWGQDDSALVEDLVRAEKYVPDLAVRKIPTCSHWVQYDAPDELNKHLLEFLGKDLTNRTNL